MFFLMSIAKMHKGNHFSSNFLLSTIVFQQTEAFSRDNR